MTVSQLIYCFIYLQMVRLDFPGILFFARRYFPQSPHPPIIPSIKCDISVVVYEYPRIADLKHVTVFPDILRRIEIGLV